MSVICALNLHASQGLPYLLSIKKIKGDQQPHVAAISNNWPARKSWE